MSAIGNAISNGYNNVMKASDALNADKLANRLVEAGYNSGLGRAGGVVAGGIGVAASAGATAALWAKMNPVDTLFRELPTAVAAQSGFLHQAIEAGAKVLEAGGETFIIANTANFGIQSVDAVVDMIKATKHQSLKLNDA